MILPLVKHAARDPRVRSAAGDTYVAGRRAFTDVRGDDAKTIVNRLVRDEGLQRDVTALVRAVTDTLDKGLASGRRRVRRISVFAILGAAGAWIVARGFRHRG